MKIAGTPLPFRPPPLALCFQKLGTNSTVLKRRGMSRDFTALGWGVLIQDRAQNGIELTGSRMSRGQAGLNISLEVSGVYGNKVPHFSVDFGF